MDLNQITLDVSNVERSARFYETLGLRRIVWSPPRYARFECQSGSTTLSLHLADPPIASGAALYFETEDVAAKLADLQQAGVMFDGPPVLQAWRWLEVWTSDPDGRRICLYHAGPDRRFPPWRVCADSEPPARE
jgi:catechol 2,3-dioxygenase-like lactoylglutathione lyase family enzyme